MKSKADTTIGEWIRTGNISKMYVNFEDKEYLDALYGGIGTMASEYIGASLGGYANTTLGEFAVSLSKNAFTDIAEFIDLKYIKKHEDMELDLGSSFQKTIMQQYYQVDNSWKTMLTNSARQLGRYAGKAYSMEAQRSSPGEGKGASQDSSKDKTKKPGALSRIWKYFSGGIKAGLRQLWHGITNLPRTLMNELTNQADTLNHIGASLFGAIGALFTRFGRSKEKEAKEALARGDEGGRRIPRFSPDPSKWSDKDERVLEIVKELAKRMGIKDIQGENLLALYGALYDLVAAMSGYRS